MKAPIIVDREMFIRFSEGILLDRDAKGNVLIVDEALCNKALDALERGEKVFLRVGDELISEMTIKDECYTEKKLSS
jgi:hypothetical protein